ncbi:MAG: AAA family ATPase, partial [Anaerolineales bacterium]|nr:AAA family ATPase [Anaerolineales bacterium]
MWNIFGQPKAVDLLKSSVEQKRLSHAYLFIGPAHIGKGTLALKLAQAVNCPEEDPPCGVCALCSRIASGANSDIQIICLAPGAKEIGIDQVREAQHTASLKAFESKCRVFIIDGADRLSVEASNSLLKILEEPPNDVLLILTAIHKGQIMPTILSRCQIVELHPTAAPVIEKGLVNQWEVDAVKAKLFSRFCNGSIGWALMAYNDESVVEGRSETLDRIIDLTAASIGDRFAYAAQQATFFAQDKEAVFETLNLWIGWWRDLLLVKHRCHDLVTNIDRMDMLEKSSGKYDVAPIAGFIKRLDLAVRNLRRNANPRLALEILMLDIPKPHHGRRKEGATAASF